VVLDPAQLVRVILGCIKTGQHNSLIATEPCLLVDGA
jgi:hypothetical protein